MSDLVSVSVVEDDPYFSFLIKKLLNDIGKFDITIYDSAEMFLSNYHITKPKFVILDYFLKGMNGQETMSQLNEMDSDPYVIVLSSQDNEEIRSLLQKKGAKKYIQKDIGWDKELAEEVKKVL